MKRILLLLAVASLVFSCSKNEGIYIETQEDLILPISNDLSVQKPLKQNNLKKEGLYSGVIVADETNFHGELRINVANDGNFLAVVKTIDGRTLSFNLKDAAGSSSALTFFSKNGSFDLNLSDFNNPVISNVIINGTPGNAKVVKETSSAKVRAVLGTFDDAVFPGTFTGTWDFLVNTSTDYITEVIITTVAGQMNIDVAANFEAADLGCYNAGNLTNPFFFQDLDPAINNYEIYSVGQIWELPNGMTIIYDFGFSKNILDANDFPYTDGVFNPAITGQYLFNPPIIEPGCYRFAANGYYLVADTGGTFIGGGKIILDTSGLVPVSSSSSFTTFIEPITLPDPKLAKTGL
ncbi:MAG TPA: hypothetical protein DEG69_05060 [Flavobacteriaceae bacterium]|jgi:hypothetical protein|nr:hypothetical protein [Flavobacteriaceae bacterium]|tara:strand:- start:74358 stop:75407 length:1050 start_codon:yes stop_codon:yes gene_type:complete